MINCLAIAFDLLLGVFVRLFVRLAAGGAIAQPLMG